MVIIEDGKGTGVKVKVTSEHELVIRGTIQTGLEYSSQKHGRSFSWRNVSYDYAAGDTILLVKNTDDDRNLHICQILVASDTTTEVILHCPICATPTGTAVTGVNLNRTALAIAADVTAIADETTNVQANVVCGIRVLANTTYLIALEGGLILGNGDCAAVDFVTDGAACSVSIFGHYYEKEE